jgi:hypothetical protein
MRKQILGNCIFEINIINRAIKAFSFFFHLQDFKKSAEILDFISTTINKKFDYCELNKLIILRPTTSSKNNFFSISSFS